MTTPTAYKKKIKCGEVDDEIMCHVLTTLTKNIGYRYKHIREMNEEYFQRYNFFYDNTEDLRQRYYRDVEMLSILLKGYHIEPNRVKCFEHHFCGKRYFLEYVYPKGTYFLEIDKTEYKEKYVFLPLVEVNEWDIDLLYEDEYYDYSNNLSLNFIRQVVDLIKKQ